MRTSTKSPFYFLTLIVLQINKLVASQLETKSTCKKAIRARFQTSGILLESLFIVIFNNLLQTKTKPKSLKNKLLAILVSK